MPFEIPNEFEREHEAYFRMWTAGSRDGRTIPQFRALAEVLIPVWIHDKSQVAETLATRRYAVLYKNSRITGRVFSSLHDVPSV